MGYAENVVIIGAGLSGLACAYRLKQLGLSPLILEATERPGGVIATVRRNGFLFELGPQFPRFPASVWRLVRELDLASEFVTGDSKAKRYILHNGQLYPAPFSPLGLFASRLIGLKSKLRMLWEPFGHTSPPDHEESLAEFAERKFGAELLDNLIDPFISTIFFGDADKMGMESAFPALVEWERSRGSLFRGALRARKAKQNNANSGSATSSADPDSASNPTSPPHIETAAKSPTLHLTDSLPALGSFQSGMTTLPEKLAQALAAEIRYKTQISSIACVSANAGGANCGWNVSLASGEQIAADHLILAVPAYAAAQLLAKAAPQLSSQLAAIEYAPICVVASAYLRSQVTHDLEGFGFMIPRREGLNTICTFWNSSLFPNRAPRERVLLTSFAGRQMAERLASISCEDCARIVETENAKILGITSPPLDREVWKEPRALPQYNVGHARRVAEISTILRVLPALHLTGNFLKGRSIGDCVDIAYRVADDVLAHRQVEISNSRLPRENI
jgi:protoporphyrinogen/coproporphyrinogen III oxidase